MDHSMTHEEWRTFNHDKKKFKSLAENRYYCYCGHSVVINPKETRVLCTHCGHSVVINPKETRVLCTHCGHWVYKDKQKYFKERLRGYINGS